MNAVFSVIILIAVIGLIIFLLSRRENTRRSQYGPAGLSEFRTDLALDECFDRLDTRSDTDLFTYECRRESRYTMMPSAQAKRQTETTAFMERPPPKEFSLL